MYEECGGGGSGSGCSSSSGSSSSGDGGREGTILPSEEKLALFKCKA